MNKKEVIEEMGDSLINQAQQYNVSLEGITIDNFNGFLDDLFDDGGETRCIHFVDLADDYSLQFGNLESDNQIDAQWECIEGAIEYIQNKLKTAKYQWNSPYDWLSDNINDISKGDLLLIIQENVDNDVIQDYFESQMEEDGYFIKQIE